MLLFYQIMIHGYMYIYYIYYIDYNSDLEHNMFSNYNKTLL